MGSLSLPVDQTDHQDSLDLGEFLAGWHQDVEFAARHACRMGMADVADDVAQEVRLRLIPVWHAHGGAVPVGYVRRTIRNAAINAARDERRAARLLHGDELPGELPAQGADAAEDLLRRSARSAVREWTRELPRNLRRVYELIYFENRSQREAAADLGVSQPRIAQLHRALVERGREALTSL